MISGTPAGVNGGYLTNEAITLSTEPGAGAYQWSLAKAQGSSSRSDLSSFTDPTPTFVPDAHGIWTVAVLVDGVTSYLLQLGVVAVAVTTHRNASVYLPVFNDAVPAPALGATLFYSRDDDRLSIKLPNGTVKGIVTT
jgi:hypothetical protein